MINFFSLRRALGVTFLLLSLLAPTLKAQTPTILVLGDSISAAYGIAEEDGWVELLRHRLKQSQQNFQVINASVSGDTTSGGLARLAAAFDKHSPRILVIELGGNDGLRGLSLKKMRNNLSAMVKLCLDRGCKPVILGMRIPSNYGEAYTERFHNSFARVAEQHDVPLAPFFLEGVATDDSLMLDDGIHPNEAAQSALLETAWPLIAEQLP
ncbi:MAG: arylesterase [Granulosicoccaceae bacterium]